MYENVGDKKIKKNFKNIKRNKNLILRLWLKVFSAVRCCESIQALLEGSRYFIKQIDVVRLQSPASDSVVPEMRYHRIEVSF